MMMNEVYNLIKYELNFNPIFVYLKTHFCPKCNHKVKTSYTNVIIKEKDAKLSDRMIGDVVCAGDVEVRTPIFWCPNCDSKIQIKQMKEFEKQKKSKK